MNKLLLAIKKVEIGIFANDLDAYIPELWAAESLILLTENSVFANLVHRDFSEVIAQQGDVVNTRRPRKMAYNRKRRGVDIVVQDAIADNVQVPLNQHVQISFAIEDIDISLSMKDLVTTYLSPASEAAIKGVDQSIATFMVAHFLDNSVGSLGTAIGKSTINALNERFNNNLVPKGGRELVLPTSQEADLLDVGDFTKIDSITMGGIALREASLGRLLSFNTYMDQNAPNYDQEIIGNAVTVGANVAGDTVIVTDNGATPIAGQWIRIEGDDTPLLVASYANPNITLVNGLKCPTAGGAAITTYATALVNNVANYATGWDGAITMDGIAAAPAAGSLTSFNVDYTRLYGVVNGVDGAGVPNPSLTSILLNDVLGTGVANDDVIGFGPSGSYGLAFHRNAVGMVSRPLAAPPQGVGVQSATVNANGVTMRATIGYSIEQQKTIVTIDFLFGLALLDVDMGAVVLGASSSEC